MTASQSSEKLSRGTVLALVAMALGIFIIANDFTALSVALPSIEKDLGTSVTTAQWVINGYALVFGVFIVTGGRLADLFGRKRIFMIGAAIFGVFSLLGGFAPDIHLVIAARVVMGIGGAMMWPAVLGMTYELLPDDKAGLAGGLVLGVAGFGNAIGPLLGGALTELDSWRWVFFVNIPIVAIGMFVTQREVTESSVAQDDRRIDYTGAAALSVSLLSLLLAMDEGSDQGWTSGPILALFALFVVGMAVFAVVERRAGSHAAVPREVMGNRRFASACVATLMMSAIFFSALLYLPQFMQKVLNYSAVESGLGLLPMMGVFAVTSFLAGPLYARVGAKPVVVAGAACLMVGIFLASFIEHDSGYSAILPGMVVLGLGVGLFYSAITTAAVTALDPSRASLAGAIVYMFQIAGGAVGLGLNTAIVTSANSLTDGISNAFKVDAVLALAGLAVAVIFISGKATTDEHRRTLRFHRAHA
jgi:EmrB/QacA subfamily drug resistance transporter